MTSLKRRSCLCLVSLMLSTWWTDGQQSDDCPRDWLDYSGHCYKFIFQPQLTYQEADLACRRQHSALLSVNSNAENAYISIWLRDHDVMRNEWYTSGIRRSGKFVWTVDGSDVTSFYFPDDRTKNEQRIDPKTYIEFNQIIYKYQANQNAFYWNWGRIMKKGSYICELPKQDIWKFYQQSRDFSFGTGETDPHQWPVAPRITQQSEDIVFFRRMSGATTPVSLDCLAMGNPHPTYRWLRKYPGEQASVLPTSSHYSITNGRLFIQRPNIEIDVATYYCEASNVHGTVLSNPIQLTYGKLDEFPNVRTDNYTSRMYMGIEIDCQAPNYKPAAAFNWFKGPTFKSVRPNLNPQMFLSRNGRLYISEVAASDAGDYFCAVQLAPRPGEKLASQQMLSRTSMAITLTVQGDNANTYGPDIQDKFPQVFPRVPLVGQRMTLECLAYGRLPLQYNWVREDAPMNPKAYMTDANRVLTIEETVLEDTGAYTCVVDGMRTSANRTRYIKLSSVPIFPMPLENKFLDIGSPFKWSCFAQGVPLPTYKWYKDGRLLEATDSDLEIMVKGRHLMFKSVTEKHNGAYECEAENALGSKRSSAQLKAVAFKPSFARNPLSPSVQASAGGGVTIQCQPEAAPRATISWRRDDGGSLAIDSFILPNGALELNTLSQGDSGTYVCEASNELGSDESRTVLTVSDQTVLTELPSSDPLPLNESTTLRCKVSHDKSKSDVVYTWKFFEHLIDFKEDIAYSMPYTNKNSGDLYVISAQYKHEGIYTCVASTVTDEVSASAYLTVTGPPEPPAGVHRHMAGGRKNHSIELWWTPGKEHGNPVTHYTVEAKPELQNEDWFIVMEDIPAENTRLDQGYHNMWRRAIVSAGLSPGSSYSFRVWARSNLVGYSSPSKPSAVYKMDDAAPIYAPSKIGGGGGKERELQITWEPLPQSKWGADHIRYKVFYRRKGDNTKTGNWQETEEMTKTEYHVLVSEDYYYTPYEVKVQAINNLGPGPVSPISDVLSAELMPYIAPTFSQANAINSTAGTVEWNRLPNIREVIKGSIFGYQVNYWADNTRCESLIAELSARFTRAYGDVTSAIVIGLEPGGDYCVNIQLLNHAGIGPKSSNFYLGMNDAAPQRYPEYVTISSHGPESVRITWRGMVNRFGEDPLLGYKGWYWKQQEDIRSAKKVDFGRSFTGVITGLEKNEVYRLRIVAYNNGGDGKKSPVVMFTLGGLVNYNPMTTEVMNFAPGPFPSKATTLILCLGLIQFIKKQHL